MSPKCNNTFTVKLSLQCLSVPASNKEYHVLSLNNCKYTTYDSTLKVRTFILHSVKKYTIRLTTYIVSLLTLIETMHHYAWPISE